MASNIPVLSSQGGVPQNSNSLEKARADLHQYSQGLMIGAAVLLISFWAAYIFPFTLMVGAVCTGLLQYTHTRDYDTMLTDSTVAGPSQVFRYLHIMNLVGVIFGFISQLLCVVSLIVNASGGDFSTVDFIFQGISFGACACITALAWMGMVKSKIVDTAVVAILSGTVPGVPTNITSASAPLVGGQMGGGYGGYGSASTPMQPAQQQGYGSANPYGQPQPVTGQPMQFSEKPAAPAPQ